MASKLVIYLPIVIFSSTDHQYVKKLYAVEEIMWGLLYESESSLTRSLHVRYGLCLLANTDLFCEVHEDKNWWKWTKLLSSVCEEIVPGMLVVEVDDI